MCAQFGLKTTAEELNKKYAIEAPKDFSFDQRIMPHTLAPVITQEGMRLKKFSLLPSWSKESKVKFATHNARIETLTEKATWKIPFQKFHCLVPLTYFIEPIYTNEHAGFMVAFSDLRGEILTAAGLYDSWINKETGEVIESFTIITTKPPPFVESIGHDRCPLFLKESAFAEWLIPKNSNHSEFLLDNQKFIEFKVENDRAMKPGWEKRL